jgi:hypothetical protein
MRRTTGFQALNEVYVEFDNSSVLVGHLPRTFDKANRLRISCEDFNQDLSSLAQFLTPFFPSIHMVEHLYIYGEQLPLYIHIEEMLWLGIFRPFTAVKNLYVSKEFAPHIARGLQALGEGRTTDVFPTLQNIFLEGLQPSEPIEKGIGKFIAVRQLSGHPIAVSLWERDSKQE